ncbi:LysR substrate-binding domain-containing protein [Variovorax terrae]|uniref:LysR substrate-binding domain-containing protein n=1 Tax=Variovorax terrae TaxID=2923278 RepID=A0A9X1W3B5_9BURK|nr:LysR substrate-binding domain-containing protein [Variovorax terrae]MCJ0765143.1 LysR substrate-binding domain-containing protein [Variovorax terrae]
MTADAIDLVTLRVIVAVADAGSISAGSNQLELAVAAASARISALEASLGIRIFERSSRGARVTPTGHMLVQRGRELLADADRLTLDLRDYSLGLKGHVRVLANGSSVLEAMPQRLERFMRRHPLIRIDLEEHSSPEICMALLEGRADLGIVDTASPPQGLELRDFFSDTLVLVVPPAHRLAGRRRLALADALEEDFIGLMDGTALSNRLISEAAALGRPVKIRMQMRSFDAVCRMVAGGLGVGVLPLQAVAPQLAMLPLKAIALSDGWAVRTHRLATRSGVALSPAAHTLVQALTA